MAWQTYLLFDRPVSARLLWFIFFGTLTSYSFHWFLTPPRQEQQSVRLKWTITNKDIHLGLFLLGGLGAAVFFFLLYDYWLWLGLSMLLAFLYSAPKIPHPIFHFLRRIAIGKTIFLSFAWMLVTALLPLMIPDESIDQMGWVFMANRFFFIYAICILFDYRDRPDDKAAGIRSLITILDEKGIDRLFGLSMFIFALTLLWMLQSFSWMIIGALLLPGLILAFLYGPSKRNFSDYHYYFVLDGLMMLSAPLVILIKFAR